LSPFDLPRHTNPVRSSSSKVFQKTQNLLEIVKSLKRFQETEQHKKRCSMDSLLLPLIVHVSEDKLVTIKCKRTV
jgi:hypothetical protein